MFSANLELIINAKDPMLSGLLFLRGSEVVAGPGVYRRLIRNDPGLGSIRICEPCFTGERAFNDINPSGGTVAIALGSVDKLPSTGTFPIGVSSANAGLLTTGKRYLISFYGAHGDDFTNVGAASNATGVIFVATGTTPTSWTGESVLKEITTALDVDATAAEVETALNATAAITAAGGVTVLLLSEGTYQVTFTDLGDQDSLTAPIFSDMFPASVIDVSTVQAGTASLREVQLIRLRENPYCYAVLSTPFASASATVTTIQTQTASLSAIKKLTLDPMPYGGTFMVTLDSVTFEAPWNATSADMQALAGASYTVVRTATNAWRFTRNTVNIAMTLSADVINLSVPVGVSGAMPMNTVGMAQAFAATEADTLRLKREVNYTASGGTPQKIYQETIEVHRDLINASDLVTPSLDVTSLTIGQSNDLSVSSAGTSTLSPGVDYSQWFQLINVGAGSGTYTRIVVIDTAGAVSGSIYRIELDIAASANPTIEIRNATAGGTLLQSVTGAADAATYFLFETRFDGTQFVKFMGAYQV